MTKKRIDPKLPIPAASDPEAKPDTYQDRLRRRLNELFLEQDGGGVEILDEGVDLGHADSLNFVGAAVVATLSSTTGTITIDASGAAVEQTITATASEAIAAGQFVAVYNSSGTPKCRVAKSSSGQGFQADGFCKAAFALNAVATIYLAGEVNVAGGTGLTAGDVWLGTDGYATNTAPTTAGYISQQIGVAQDGTHVAFEPQLDILVAATHSVTTGGSSQSTVVTSTTTVTINTAVGAGFLTMTGAGGGGKSTANAAAAGGGGGGAGEYCQNLLIPLTPGETITVNIGAGGTAGNDGGATSVVCAAGTFSVLGGKAAPSGAGGAGAGPRGAAGGGAGNPGAAGALGTAESPAHFGGSSGGGAASGASTSGGVGGGGPGNLTGGAAGTGNTHGGGGGGGGASPWGVGGAGGAGNAGGSNAPAGSYGAGGGGAGGNDATGQTGGTGANGYVLLMYVA